MSAAEIAEASGLLLDGIEALLAEHHDVGNEEATRGTT